MTKITWRSGAMITYVNCLPEYVRKDIHIFFIYFDDTIKSNQLCGAFLYNYNSDLRLASYLREHIGWISRSTFPRVLDGVFPFCCEIAPHTPPIAPSFWFDLPHHDRLTTINPHQAMDHRADPVHLASGNLPKPCFVLLYIHSQRLYLVIRTCI